MFPYLNGWNVLLTEGEGHPYGNECVFRDVYVLFFNENVMKNRPNI